MLTFAIVYSTFLYNQIVSTGSDCQLSIASEAWAYCPDYICICR